MELRERIAEAFERRVASDGYAKTTLDDVARELHISKKTIYVHFDGKREIYAHIVRRQADRERRRMTKMIAEAPTVRGRVEALTRLVIGSGRAHVVATTEEEWLQEYEIAADAFRTAHGDLLRELITEGMDSGEIPRGDARLAERMIAAMVVEYLVMVNADPAYDRDEELVGRILRFIG